MKHVHNMAYIFISAVVTHYFRLHLLAVYFTFGKSLAFWLKRIAHGRPLTEFIVIFVLFTAAYVFCQYIARELPRLPFKKALVAAGIEGANKKPPRIVRLERSHEGKITSIFCYGPGLGLDAYESIKNRMELSTGQDIEWIRRDEKTGRLVEIAFTKIRLPKLVRFKDASDGIGEVPFRFVVGKSKLETVYKDITELPHLIVAGSTNSGKSNFLNGFIISMLKSPSRVRMNLIDLKHGVEFSRYEGVEGVTVASTEAGAVKMLNRLCNEMDSRYKKMKKLGVEKLDTAANNMDLEVLVIDEAAVLFDMSGKDQEGKRIHQEARNLADDLARRSRAAGIHVVVATQKVTKETIDSRIQGNIESKLCFKVPSEIHSRLVIERGDAAHLPDIKGRAIWHRGNDYTQVQVPLIERKEIKDEIKKLKLQRKKRTRVEKSGNSSQCSKSQKSQPTGPEDSNAPSEASPELDSATA